MTLTDCAGHVISSEAATQTQPGETYDANPHVMSGGGHYQFTGLHYGTYCVDESMLDGTWTQTLPCTYPAPACNRTFVDIPSGSHFTARDFGNYEAVGINKDGDPSTSAIDGLANLWLCTASSCSGNGQGYLDVAEFAHGVGADPQGVGAFEFQVKYDNHVFDITIGPTGWLYSTGRIPDDGSGAGGCVATIISENDIRFGCVSKNPQPVDAVNGSCLGPDNQTPVLGAVCGPTTDGQIATLHVTPKPDLVKRLTPGNDNGAIRTLLDEGCELADVWGHPLSSAPAPFGVDALGREIPLPGIEPGGLVTDCSDLTITVRILEGDMNTDCVVDVTDDQMEAAHYGASFGTLFYDPWFDLEPALDYDVDIKDLQKVFGRNGSTCDDPFRRSRHCRHRATREAARPTVRCGGGLSPGRRRPRAGRRGRPSPCGASARRRRSRCCAG